MRWFKGQNVCDGEKETEKEGRERYDGVEREKENIRENRVRGSKKKK